MRAVALQEIADSIEYGVTASANPQPVGPKFLRITDIQNGSVDWSSVPYCEADSRKLSASRLQKGDIVFARTGATTGKSFLIRECPQEAVFASYLIRVRPGKEVDPLFLSYFFDSPNYWNQIALKAAGAAQPGVNSSKLKELEIPLPPLEEQKRVAAILDKADALRRRRQRALDKLNTLGQSIFREMFGSEDIQGIAQPLEELVEEFRYGTSNKATDTGYPTLRIPNVIGGGLDLSDLKTVPVTPAELARLALESRDVLFVRTNGNPDYVGRSAVFEPEMVAELGFDQTKWIYASYLIRARLRLGKLHPVFLQYFLTTPRGRRALRERCKTSAGQFNINTKGLGSLSIPVPKIDRQHKFADKIINIGNEIGRYRSSVKSLDGLFASLQQRAFRGEL